MRPFNLYVVALLASTISAAVSAEDFEFKVPLTRATSGNLYVEGVLNEQIRSSFLVDTGSGLVTINQQLFDELAKTSRIERVGRMAARMANGRLQALDLYRVERFRIGEHCELGAVDVAVMSRDGGNILGLNVLARAAPFAMHVSPPTLALSACGLPAEFVAAK
jgi:predicted aspartyl protease